ncbi:hypothetical protein F183_A35220 [Bryobacterales bacterium F-183]|nr:hypothetical protein F183_A35220 [Bryobacterales bacterium F-183]
MIAVWIAAFTFADIHHVTLNVTDPEAAIQFYTSRFECRRALFEGREPAIQAQDVWIFLNRVKKAPPSKVESAIWHIGWGAEDMPAEYKRQLALGTRFDTPITDISKLANTPGFYYAYVAGPNGELIELNTARHHRFGHLHLFSADPISAWTWYTNNLGMPTPRREPSREKRFYEGFQVGPAASFTNTGINVIIYPADRKYVSNRGRAIGEIGFRVQDLDTLLKDKKPTVLKKPHAFRGSRTLRAATIEGPDKIAIELVEPVNP